MAHTVELLRSRLDGETLAVTVAGIRHGPDLGPWEVLGRAPLADAVLQKLGPSVDDQARKFMATATPEQERRASPGIPTEETMRLRLALVAEKFLELLDAAVGLGEYVRLAGAIRDVIRDAPLTVDLPALANACADLDYVVAGLRVACGIDGKRIAALIHAANMAKTGGPRRADGKLMKPDGWRPPDVAGELRRQGWLGGELHHCRADEHFDHTSAFDAPPQIVAGRSGALDGEQPAPLPGSGPAVWDLVVLDVERWTVPRCTPDPEVRAALVRDMRARDALGEARYGVRLRAHNGRRALQDAYEEALDQVVYLRQAAEERGSSVPAQLMQAYFDALVGCARLRRLLDEDET